MELFAIFGKHNVVSDRLQAFATLLDGKTGDVCDYENHRSLFFVRTFVTSLPVAIIKFAGKWVADPAGCYNSHSGVTTNAAESLNYVLHRLIEWKERPADCLLISLKYLQSFYEREIERGIHGLGNFVVCERFSAILQPSNMLPTASDNMSPEDIVAFVKGGLLATTPELTKQEPIEARSLAAEALAKESVQRNQVAFVPDLKSFVVQGSREQKYAVTLFPNESCQCPSTRTCYHIMAAKLFMGMPVPQKKTVLNLSQLRKRRSGGRQKSSGRKKPRVGDYEINPAPDSVEAVVPISGATTVTVQGCDDEQDAKHGKESNCFADAQRNLATYAKKAPGNAVGKLASTTVVNLDGGQGLPCSTKGGACVVRFDDKSAVLLNKTQLPASPIIFIYTGSPELVNNERFLVKSASFVATNEFCKAVSLVFKCVNPRVQIWEVLKFILEGKGSITVSKTMEKVVNIVCICRATHIDSGTNGSLIKCSASPAIPVCCRQYHTACLKTEAPDLGTQWRCPVCSFPQELPSWGCTHLTEAENTCPFDNYLAAMFVHATAHPHFKEALSAVSPEMVAIRSCLDHLLDGDPGHAKDIWMNFLRGRCPPSVSSTGKLNFHGTEWDRFLKFFASTWSIKETSLCKALSCPKPAICIQRNSFSANSAEDINSFTTSFTQAFETNCSKTFKDQPSNGVEYFISPSCNEVTGETFRSYCCASSRVVGPAEFLSPHCAWILPSHVGGLCSIDDALRFPCSIVIHDLRFTLSCVTLYSPSEAHFTALIRWQNMWIHYDGIRQGKISWYSPESIAIAGYNPNYAIYLLV